MNKVKLFFLVFTLFNFSTFPQMVSACSVCGCGDPLAAAGSAHPLAGTFRLSFENVYLTASALSDDDSTQTEAVRQVNLNTTLTYSPTNDLSLTAMVPIVEKYWTLSTGDAAPDAGTPFGLGDMMFGARYFFLSDTDLQTKQHTGLAVSGGAYVPTGRTNFRSLITGNNLDTHSQLGTGGWGFYGGLLFNRVWDDFSLSANVNVILRTTPSTTDTDSPVYQYTFGNSFTGGVQGQWHMTDNLALSLAAEGRDAEPDTALNDDGTAIEPVDNTGGWVLDATPGVWWNIGDNSTVYAKVQIPVYTNLNGIQEVDPTYIAGVQFLIK